MEEFNVGVMGAGYVGLVTGACLAHIGHEVTLVDNNEDRVAGLERGADPHLRAGDRNPHNEKRGPSTLQHAADPSGA